jgi:hypothetical protein
MTTVCDARLSSCPEGEETGMVELAESTGISLPGGTP